MKEIPHAGLRLQVEVNDVKQAGPMLEQELPRYLLRTTRTQPPLVPRQEAVKISTVAEILINILAVAS
jgi:hypothetical protein